MQAAKREVWAAARADVAPRFSGLGFQLGGPELGPTVQQILKVGGGRGRGLQVLKVGQRRSGGGMGRGGVRFLCAGWARRGPDGAADTQGEASVRKGGGHVYWVMGRCGPDGTADTQGEVSVRKGGGHVYWVVGRCGPNSAADTQGERESAGMWWVVGGGMRKSMRIPHGAGGKQL